jgi:hypothetical protein
MALQGTRVRLVWPDGSLSDGCGVITHVSPASLDREARGLLVRWDSYYDTAGELRSLPSPALSFVADPAWLARADGSPLVVPPQVERVRVLGGVL